MISNIKNGLEKSTKGKFEWAEELGAQLEALQMPLPTFLL